MKEKQNVREPTYLYGHSFLFGAAKPSFESYLIDSLLQHV